MYPPQIPSIRMKIIRDGLEDYGYLMELQKILPTITAGTLRAKAETILKIPQQVMVDTHYFNRHPDGMLGVRAEIGGILDAVSKK